MKKLLYIMLLSLAVASCSSDDSVSNVTDPVNIARSEVIDWVEGNAVNYGLNFSVDELIVPSNAGFTNLYSKLHIIPKPGYEDVKYSVYIENYTLSKVEIYRKEFIGELTTDPVSIVTSGTTTFHISMSKEFKYDAELILKPEAAVGTLPQKTAKGHERQ